MLNVISSFMKRRCYGALGGPWHPRASEMKEVMKIRFSPHTGIIHKRRRVSPSSAHKSRIASILESGKAPGLKRIWR